MSWYSREVIADFGGATSSRNKVTVVTTSDKLFIPETSSRVEGLRSGNAHFFGCHSASLKKKLRTKHNSSPRFAFRRTQHALHRCVCVRLRVAIAAFKRARQRMRRNAARTLLPRFVSSFKGSATAFRHFSMMPAAHSKSPSRKADNASSSYARTHISGFSVALASPSKTRRASATFSSERNARAFQNIARSRYFGAVSFS